MAKARNRQSAASIEDSLVKVRAKLENARTRCEKIEAEYKSLLDRRDRMRMEQLAKAMKESDRTFEEVLNFIRR